MIYQPTWKLQVDMMIVFVNTDIFILCHDKLKFYVPNQGLRVWVYAGSCNHSEKLGFHFSVQNLFMVSPCSIGRWGPITELIYQLCLLDIID